ncbi:MAG: hypothetical protein M0Z59_10900 [Nitrospiraceae bacterium]|nr:hypothetical protein [Nitrospiraceae bacterium]
MKTALWLLGAVILFMLYGSIAPSQGAMQGMDSGPLLWWLVAAPLALSWWLWASIAALALLALSTVLCSVDSIIKKRGGLLLSISPQVIHLGFLFILLAHLLSSVGGAKAMGYVQAGPEVETPLGFNFRIGDIEVQKTSPDGYITGWHAVIQFISGGKVLKEGLLAPNKPAFFRGYGFYLRDLRPGPEPAALIEASREPGAPWALAGGVLFILGTVALVALRIRQE